MRKFLLILLVFCSCRTGSSTKQQVVASDKDQAMNTPAVCTEKPGKKNTTCLPATKECIKKAITTTTAKAQKEDIASAEINTAPALTEIIKTERVKDSIQVKTEEESSGSDIEGYIPFIKQYGN